MQKYLILIFLFGVVIGNVNAQISSSVDDGGALANYEGHENDYIFLFCTDDSLASEGELYIVSPFDLSSTFDWEVYDPNQSAFVPFSGTVVSDTIRSTISNLADGCYRVTVRSGGMATTYQTWALNNWLFVEPEISESNCEYMVAEFTLKSKNLKYYDIYNHVEKGLSKEYTYQWSEGNDDLSSSKTLTLYRSSLSCENTDYTIEVSDDKGCAVEETVTYESIIPCADMAWDPVEGEAPLEVAFTNNSINYGLDSIEWRFHKSNLVIDKEASDNPGEPVDSLWFTLREDNPIYTYEETGEYNVQLVVRSEEGCRDTIKTSTPIDVYVSLVEAPNFFSPNNDDVNDNWVIRTQSLKSLEIVIFNRWGRKVHVYKDRNVTSSEETMALSIWDGTIGGRKASPGVYFYIINAMGRDDVEYKKEGFMHLFTTKDARP